MKNSLFAHIIVFAISVCSIYAVQPNGEFKTSYDEVQDITFIMHKDMQKGMIYNLKDSISGERENIQLYIANKTLIAAANYQGSDWMFINGIVFLGSNGDRLKLDYGTRPDSDVKSGALKNVYVREEYTVALKGEDIATLENLLTQPKVYVAFLGKRPTKKMELKAKYVNAVKATIEKWKSQYTTDVKND